MNYWYLFQSFQAQTHNFHLFFELLLDSQWTIYSLSLYSCVFIPKERLVLHLFAFFVSFDWFIFCCFELYFMSVLNSFCGCLFGRRKGSSDDCMPCLVCLTLLPVALRFQGISRLYFQDFGCYHGYFLCRCCFLSTLTLLVCQMQQRDCFSHVNSISYSSQFVNQLILLKSPTMNLRLCYWLYLSVISMNSKPTLSNSNSIFLSFDSFVKSNSAAVRMTGETCGATFGSKVFDWWTVVGRLYSNELIWRVHGMC